MKQTLDLEDVPGAGISANVNQGLGHRSEGLLQNTEHRQDIIYPSAKQKGYLAKKKNMFQRIKFAFRFILSFKTSQSYFCTFHKRRT